MKKLLMLAAMMVGSFNAFGAFVQCTPNNPDITNATQVYTCAGQGAALDSILYNNVTVFVIANGNITGGPGIIGTVFSATVDNTANSAGYNLVADIPLSCTAVAGGGLAGCTTGNQNASASTALANVDVIAGFTVTLQGIPGQNSLPINASVAYDATETSAVPEPGTLALLGSALVGIGVVARRRK